MKKGFRHVKRTLSPERTVVITLRVMEPTPKATSCLKGVKYVLDEKGELEAVLIDLVKHGQLWEDFQDLLVSRSRRKEPRERLGDVEVRLRKARKF